MVSTDPLSQLLEQQPVVILDGALGTELERRGVVLTGTKLWSAQLLIDNPDLLRQIHEDYYKSGADVVTTATYQASQAGFQSAGISWEDAARYIRLAVDLAVAARDAFWAQHVATHGSQAAPAAGELTPQSQLAAGVGSDGSGRGVVVAGRQRPLVGFSSGSYGASLCDGSEFSGGYGATTTVGELAEYHRQRLEPVAGDVRVDLLCFETVPCAQEARAIVQLLSMDARFAGAHAWVSMSCRDDEHTCAGESFAGEVVPLLWSCPQVVGIGVNCTAPAHVACLLAAAKGKLQQLAADAAAGHAATRARPPVLLTYPNSGEGWDGENGAGSVHQACLNQSILRSMPGNGWQQEQSVWEAAAGRLQGT
eukprot:CAMPEP_0202863284 /NCGR_PEP_ID=MMETSP1391-20130828/3977_1 /ASSEMBLY_ACC=CAM_ASM_000867 /TAXON_ID=1034604 /ORGANISM="Chlamydomonas leiostraca, Strain SAG 11-49" /LENGTH=365 /DNA_ID=CAMNT_0049542901 /DNA_START=126 /DNA_END=1224 /DNA_ORIENTATION=+